jgi:hypothetical protein
MVPIRCCKHASRPSTVNWTLPSNDGTLTYTPRNWQKRPNPQLLHALRIRLIPTGFSNAEHVYAPMQGTAYVVHQDAEWGRKVAIGRRLFYHLHVMPQGD